MKQTKMSYQFSKNSKKIFTTMSLTSLIIASLFSTVFMISCSRKMDIVPVVLSSTDYAITSGLWMKTKPGFPCTGGNTLNCGQKVSEEEFKNYKLENGDMKTIITTTRVGDDSLQFSFVSNEINFNSLVSQEEYLVGRQNANNYDDWIEVETVNGIFKKMNITNFNNEVTVKAGHSKIVFPPNYIQLSLNNFSIFETWTVAKNGNSRREILVRTK